MKIYHFIKKQFGLEAIRDRRIKVSVGSKINDPLEFSFFYSKDDIISGGLNDVREILINKTRFISFSKNPTSPVMWSQYADWHQGLCLGFYSDLQIDTLLSVKYSSKRCCLSQSDIKNWSENHTRDLLTRKHAGWKYEREVRFFCEIDELIKCGEHEFYKFTDPSKSKALVLTDVIVGACSNCTREEILSLVGSDSGIKIFKAERMTEKFGIQVKRWV